MTKPYIFQDDKEAQRFAACCDVAGMGSGLYVNNNQVQIFADSFRHTAASRIEKAKKLHKACAALDKILDSVGIIKPAEIAFNEKTHEYFYEVELVGKGLKPTVDYGFLSDALMRADVPIYMKEAHVTAPNDKAAMAVIQVNIPLSDELLRSKLLPKNRTTRNTQLA